MDISFQKFPGDANRGISFFWKLSIETHVSGRVEDHFIPELFFDYFFVKAGKIQCVDEYLKTKNVLPQQSLKMIYTRPLRFIFSTPLVLYGARLSLRFAESFWEETKANCFLKQSWAEKDADDLGTFGFQILANLKRYQTKKLPYPMFASDLNESAWLVNFSERHKRRLYKSAFGLSRKELQTIHNVHAFLEQTCDFASENPRIIRHVNPNVFYDQPHLNHTFKKLTGRLPVEYFEASSILQDNLMSASYNEISHS